jgi:hypothetical protein
LIDITRGLRDDRLYKFNKSAVVLFPTMGEFKLFHEKITEEYKETPTLQNKAPKEFRFLVYLNELVSLEKLREVMKPYGKNNFKEVDVRHFEYFITHDSDSVVLAANLLFSDQSCLKFDQKELNRFSKRSSEWEKPLVDFKHFDNFFGCKVPFEGHFYNDEIMQHRKERTESVLKEALKPGGHVYVKGQGDTVKSLDHPIMVEKAERKSNFRGLLFDVVEIMSKRANFTPSYKYKAKTDTIVNDSPQGFELINEPVYSWSTGISMVFHQVMQLSFVDLIFLVTLNDRYTNFEKLWFAFDETTWMLLGITFVFTFGSIFIINLTPKRVRRIIYGKGEESFN